MDVSHNFRFRWNDHVPHLSQIFSELRLEEVYCDTTLISDDGFVLKAHGAVLSATSRYFERVLSEVTADQHPIIVLKGANFVELSCLLDYIYQGVTQVDQHLMESVLDAADMLEIKGLSKMKNNLSIKKLIAPSPQPTTISRNSPTCSSPSKSPLASSPPSRSHSPCCLSPADDSLLKVDTDTNEDERHSFVDTKAPLDARVESQDYGVSKHGSNSEYLDQTLGIDLSLSRATNTDADRNSSKSFTNYDDTPLRKRKIMTKSEEFSAPLSDTEWRKFGEKTEDSVPHKKMKLSTRSASHMKTSPCGHEETQKSASQFTLEKLASMLSKNKGESKLLNDVGNTSVEVCLDSQVEVLCSDGALTISVTTDCASGRPAPSKCVSKGTSAAGGARLSLSLRKAKKKLHRGRRAVLEAMKKENALLKRPNTRLLKRLKSCSSMPVHTHRRGHTETESLSVHCDSIFSTDDHAQSQTTDKDALEDDRGETHSRHDGGSGVDRTSEERKKPSCISPVNLYTLPPTKQKEKQTRNSLTLQEKMKVIEAFLDGKSQRQIAALHGIGKTQVNGIVKRREQILSLYKESVVRGDKLTSKRHRRSEFASLNEHLIKWYRHMTVVAGVQVSTGTLRAKALQIAPQLGYRDFKASNGWLATFKSNHGLKLSKASKASESPSSEPADEGQRETDIFEDDETEEAPVNMGHGIAPQTASSHGPGIAGDGGLNPHGVGLHLGLMRGGEDTDPDNGTTTQPPPPPVTNIIGNSILTSSGPLPKPPQMSNMALGSNIAYNLSREPRSDLPGHLSDLHGAPGVNGPSSIPHPSLPKPPEAALAYKTEDALSYGYDTQGRMNEGTTRGTEYTNYAPYGFPSTYYGYHFLGQY